MMAVILTVLGLVWFAIGSVLPYGTLTALATDKPARQALRRKRRDRFHAEAIADFFRSELAVLGGFTVVMVGWPYFLCPALQRGGLTGR